MRFKSCLLGAVALLTFTGTYAAAQDNNASLIDRGKYLATAGDCAACHTAAGGKPFAGGYAFHLPIGTIISSNITPSKASGVGNWSEEEFARAVRAGVRPDGTHLYPAMPYTEYATITDDDMKALYAYFEGGVQPVEQQPPTKTTLTFPFNLPGVMFAWNTLFLNATRFTPDSSVSSQINRGHYLADGLGHCTTCHTPRNDLMAPDNSKYLSGAVVDGWRAPNITSDAISGVGGWSDDEIVQYLRNGHVHDKSQAGGPMADAIQNSFRFLQDDDLHAIAAYLKTVPPIATKGQERPAFAPADVKSADFTSFEFPIPGNQSEERFSTTQTDGASIYNSSCAACHGIAGTGAEDGTIPSLLKNRAVGSVFANGVVMAVADGIHRQGADGIASMPAFSSDKTAIHSPLTNDQIAAVTNYVRQQFGGMPSKLTGPDVASESGGGENPTFIRFAPEIAIAGFGAAAIIVIGFIAFLFRRGRRPRPWLAS